VFLLPRSVCHSARLDMQSIGENPSVVCDYLRGETEPGKLVGPLHTERLCQVFILITLKLFQRLSSQVNGNL